MVIIVCIITFFTCVFVDYSITTPTRLHSTFITIRKDSCYLLKSRLKGKLPEHKQATG